MSERKQQNLYVPLRVRFRSAAERAQWEREQAAANAPTMPGIPETPDDSMLQSPAVTYPHGMEVPQRAQRIKEVIRLGNVLRAELGLNEVLQQIIASLSACTGFRSSAINLVEQGSEYLAVAAQIGSSEENALLLTERPITREQMQRLMRPEFLISQSYFVPHERSAEFSDIPAVVDLPLNQYEPGGWHPEDALLVPLFSPRKKKVLGFLSLDDPQDGKIPTQEHIEIIELFANQAAIAIDNAVIFQEREAERLVLEQAIDLLCHDLKRLQSGDLRVHVQSSHEKLQPIVQAVNTMIEEFSEILGSVQKVTEAVDEHAQDVWRGSEVLAHDTSQQEHQVESISRVIDDMASTMKRVSECAEKMSQVASEATEVTGEGQEKVDRAYEGMRSVRETTMQSARIIKRLGESGQEINDTVVEITDLTTRMNLLALNAAIEAVRAGERGQGFVVIAQEIRSLAVSSAEAARKVSSRIRAIQNQMTTVSQSVDQHIQQVVVQTELVTQASVALAAIGVVTEQMVDLVQGLGPAAISQAQGSQQVAHSVEDISRMASEIAQQCGHMQQSLEHLVELTNSLRNRLSVIRIAER